MYRNTLTLKKRIKSALKRALMWSIFFTAAVLPWRARVAFCTFIHKLNYKKKEGKVVGERLTVFFLD